MIKQLVPQPGVEVSVDGQRCQITQVLDLEHVLVRALANGEIKQVRLTELQLIASEETSSDHDTDTQQIDEARWQQAQARFAIIRPLLEQGDYGRADVAVQAQSSGYSTATVYRWLRQYQRAGVVSALIPDKRGATSGQRRLSAEVNAIIDATIDDTYLSDRKPSVRHAALEIERRCRNAGLPVPHANTVRHRIRQLSPRKKRARREGVKAAQDSFSPIRGLYPDADWPLAVWQIDHTPADLIVVDDRDRQPIGRPWLTVAIDVFSRMVAGLYISLDPPSAMSVGLCLAHAMLPKELWLAKHQIETPWPVWGKPAAVHSDNAKEFRGQMLARAYENLGIDVYWRPVARPHFGGHIERLCGTLNDAIHTLPGTTFSNTQQRGSYRAEDKAALTLEELERWLAIQIVDVYHQQYHEGIAMAPIKRYEQGIVGTNEQPGIGLPERFLDETRLRLELMPYEERTVQRYGIQLDEIGYYHEVLKPWINSVDPDNPRRKRRFLIRRDPRDISVIYFFDPEVQEYYAIPYRNTTHPPMSLWELREIRRQLKEQGHSEVDEVLIFTAYNRLKAIETEAISKTKAARRKAQRQRHHASTERPLEPAVKTAFTVIEADDSDDIEPFDELEELDG